jgi:hypothetical protein
MYVEKAEKSERLKSLLIRLLKIVEISVEWLDNSVEMAEKFC